MEAVGEKCSCHFVNKIYRANILFILKARAVEGNTSIFQCLCRFILRCFISRALEVVSRSTFLTVFL
jgi:hypothetical protein